MKKRILFRLSIFILLLLIVVSITWIYKIVNGTNIEHYAQYIFPCQGQIITMKNEETSIDFIILDEKEISELSDKKNINAIYFETTDGKEIKVSDWEIYGDAGSYQSDKFSMKQLKVCTTLEKEVVIKNLKIVYPDKEEMFDIGMLKIVPLDVSNQTASTHIISTLIGDGTDNVFINEDTELLPYTSDFMHFTAYAFEDITVNNIDFGIDGLGIEPSTLQEVPKNMDFGQSFMNDPDNSVYLSQNPLDKLPKQDLELHIDGGKEEYTNYIIAIRESKEYKNVPISTYFAPLYTCTENSTNVKYTYGDLNYMILSPQIVNDKNAERLLKEYGI